MDWLLSWLLRLRRVSKDAFVPEDQRIAYQWWCLYGLAEIARPDHPPAPVPKPEEKHSILKRVVQHCSRIHVAKLDDAWVALEQAERLLSGRSRSPQWWGRLCALRLKVFAAHWNEQDAFALFGAAEIAARFDAAKLAYLRRLEHVALLHKITREFADEEKIISESEGGRPLAFSSMAVRRKIDYREYLVSLLRVGLAVWPDDTYRRLRLADYFIRAWKRHYGHEKPSPDVRILLIEALETGPNTVDARGQIAGKYGILNQYRNALVKQVEQFVSVEENVVLRSHDRGRSGVRWNYALGLSGGFATMFVQDVTRPCPLKDSHGKSLTPQSTEHGGAVPAV